jgi:hypothetical protein
MNKAFWLVSGIGLGTGLMYMLDPAKGQRRRSRMQSRARTARYQLENAFDRGTSALGSRARNLATTSRGWLQRAEESPSRLWPYAQRYTQRTGGNSGGLLLGSLGLSAALVYMLSSSRLQPYRSKTYEVTGKTLDETIEWTRGFIAGVRNWFVSENGTQKPSAGRRQTRLTQSAASREEGSA